MQPLVLAKHMLYHPSQSPLNPGWIPNGCKWKECMKLLNWILKKRRMHAIYTLIFSLAKMQMWWLGLKIMTWKNILRYVKPDLFEISISVLDCLCLHSYWREDEIAVFLSQYYLAYVTSQTCIPTNKSTLLYGLQNPLILQNLWFN